MPQEVYWSPIAVASFLDVKEFTLKCWGQKVVDEFEIIVDIRVSQISSNSAIAPLMENSNYRKLVIHRNVALIYDVLDDRIRIHLVWDNRQAPQKLTSYLKID